MSDQLPIEQCGPAMAAEAFEEQGIAVFRVSDYEFIAAATQDQAVTFACDLWGYNGTDAAKRAEESGCFVLEDVERCDLDTNRIQICDDNERPTGERITFRESVRRQIAEGRPFPQFFAGFDI